MATRKVNLLQVVEEQKREIDKYKTNLRNVTTAYRTLLEEKRALEQSLQALQKENVSADGTSIATNETEDAKQLSAVIDSLKTITASKAAMETSYQADRKQLREEKEAAQLKCEELVEKLKKLEVEMEEWKSKLIIERHDRDKEQADHGAIMKELQDILALERTQRLKLEEQQTKLKRQVGDVGGKRIEEYEKSIGNLQNELEKTRRQLELAEKERREPTPELVKLQDELRYLQIEHQTAIKLERERAEQVEDRAKRQAVAQEERVRALESRLAELSASVGAYDRLREQDQTEITKLKEHLAAMSLSCLAEDMHPTEESSNGKDNGIGNQNQLTAEVRESDVHLGCTEEITFLKRKLSLLESELSEKNKNPANNPAVDALVRNLQERIRLISEESKVREKQHTLEIDNWKQLLRTEKTRAKETLSAAETDFRGRLNLLETQLQKLRERSMALLEDKEQEIHSLQGTFQTFLPGARSKEASELPSLTSMRDGPRMLHYANELARRDVDIAGLRRAKHNLEVSLRDLQRDAAADQEEIQKLRDEIERLKSRHTRGGLNLEYLKNVVLSFLVTNDAQAKRHMANAIAAVLKFTPEEQDKIAKQSYNHWWLRSAT